MIDIKAEIISAIKQSLREFTSSEINFLVEKPENESFGDYSSNIAMVLWANKKLRVKNPHFAQPSPRLRRAGKALAGRQESKSPFELAQKIVDFIIHNSQFMIHFDRVEAVAPGFVNFWISKEYLISSLSKIDNLSKPLKNKRIMVEFTDPNPFKEFHIGHLYSNTVGESISRLLEALGANLKRANYQGDVGLHVAKALYGLLQLTINNLQLTKLDKKPLEEKVEILGQCYALGAKVYEENEKAKKEIEQLNKKIYDKDPAIMGLYEKGRRWSLEYLETVYKRLGTQFDFYYFESEVGIDGLKLVKEYLKKGPPASLDAKHLRAGIFEESQGAVIFPGEKHGLHNRVFINSLGLPTYEAKELGLALKKYRDFNYDQSIVVTGNEVIGYFKVLLAALGKIKPDLAAKTKHLSHGMVKLPTGKISSRSGNIITAEWLLDEAKKLLGSKYSEMNEETLEKVAVGAVKYALLKSSLGHDIEFDFKESINIAGNSGPYLQYTFARTQSVLRKAQNTDLRFKINDLRLENEELALLRSLNRFPEVVGEAGKNFAPNVLCNYLFDLAQKFNLFYQKHRIIDSENQNFRLALVQAAGIVIKNGLYLLGIFAPEKM